MKIKDKSISLLGIIFPNTLGNLSVILYVFTIAFIKLKNNFLSKKFLVLNTTTLTLAYVLIHTAAAFLFYDFKLNTEFKALFFLAVSSIVLSSNKRFRNLNELHSSINYIIFYLFLIALFVVINKGVIFRFPDLNPIKYGFNSIYVGSLFVIVFAIFKDKLIKIKSIIIIILSGSGTALSGLLLYLGISNLSIFKKSKTNILKLVFSLILIAFLILILNYTQSFRSRNLLDIETLDRFIIQSSFLNYYFQEFTLTKFLFGTTFKGSLTAFTDYIDNPIIKSYIESKFLNEGTIGANALHNEHFRIIFHFGFLGYVIYLRQLFLLIDKNKVLYTTLIWMQFFNPIIYVNSTFLFLILLSNFKLNDNK